MTQLIEYVVGIHRSVNVSALVMFYGIAGALLCFVLLQVARSRALKRRLADLEGRFVARLDDRSDQIERRVGGVESRAVQLFAESETVRRRVDQVEERIPNLYERMEEFRNTLARIFQDELGAVLGSFDTSVAAVLDQMKTDLRMGITRIESIESMVHSREKAGRNLLSVSDGRSLPEAEEEAPMDLGDETAEVVAEKEPGAATEEQAKTQILRDVTADEIEAGLDEDEDYQARAA